MNTGELLNKIRQTDSPLKRQLLMVGLLSKLLEEQGKGVPIVIGGCALSYYSREVYFTADIDLAYPDRELLNKVLQQIGFNRQGRYWVNDDLKIAIEVPVSILAGEDSPIEIVELGDELRCMIIGIEDLIIDRMNACKHWKSEIDCEMVELLLIRYGEELDWLYLEKKASLPENNVLQELRTLTNKKKL